MKFIDINRKFTAAVSSYMAQGYYINAASMSGSQGEIAHIDLTDGKQIVRVLLDSFTEWEDYNQLEGLKLVVGIAADNVNPNDNQRGCHLLREVLQAEQQPRRFRVLRNARGGHRSQ